MYFDYLIAGLAATSAYFWARSAQVEFPFGFNMEVELRKAAKKAGRLNAIAAGLAAVAAALPAVKTFGTFMGWIL